MKKNPIENSRHKYFRLAKIENSFLFSLYIIQELKDQSRNLLS